MNWPRWRPAGARDETLDETLDELRAAYPAFAMRTRPGPCGTVWEAWRRPAGEGLCAVACADPGELRFELGTAMAAEARRLADAFPHVILTVVSGFRGRCVFEAVCATGELGIVYAIRTPDPAELRQALVATCTAPAGELMPGGP